jgi:1,2-phenylacetyl-CoA epoxidase PaaB subunit
MTLNIQEKSIDRASELGDEEPIYYEVFARENSGTPLTHIGSIEAPNLELAKARAWFVYTERTWLELCIAPTSSITSLTDTSGRKNIREV